MRFRSLLIHRCSLLTIMNTGETDDYGRDIVSRIEQINVPCRFDQIRERAVSDETGTDFILENVLYFDQDHDITMETEFLNITDKKGNPVIQGSFSVINIMPIYDRSKLHHYEVAVKRK